MRLSSSTQPTSTTRWPSAGFSPVVSVSRTISRIAADRSTSRHLTDLREDFTYLLPGSVKSLPAVHDEIGARPLLGIRHLLCEQRFEFFHRHAGPRHHAGTLDVRRRGNHHHG